jgi:hypothetical protein
MGNILLVGENVYFQLLQCFISVCQGTKEFYGMNVDVLLQLKNQLSPCHPQKEWEILNMNVEILRKKLC